MCRGISCFVCPHPDCIRGVEKSTKNAKNEYQKKNRAKINEAARRRYAEEKEGGKK